MHNFIMRNQGRAVEVRDHGGRVHRGVIGRVDPRRGVFIHNGFKKTLYSLLLNRIPFLEYK